MSIMRFQSLSATRKCVLGLMLVLGLTAVTTPLAHAQTFSVVHDFGGSDGGWHLAGLIIDGAGNLYGTTSNGGTAEKGVVFKVDSRGQETVLYSFTGGADGADPEASLVMDAAGNLYGTTNAGGTAGAGTVFKLTQKRKETVLYSFTGKTDGANPQAALVMDAAGNLYGTTSAGGASGNGTVFKLTPKKTGSKWREKVLYSFGSGTDGAIPVASVTLDTAGKLYGTTSAGGSSGYGTVFRLKPTKSGWKERILYNFQGGDDGTIPYAGLIFDQSGNLYGATTQGGTGAGGTVFEPTPSNGSWRFSVLYALPGWGIIAGPFRNLFLDASGKIYGTTHCDGANEAGTVFELTPSSGAWTYTLLYDFTGGSDCQYSYSNPVFDKHGSLYGTTNQGGTNGWGVVFKITP